eukprot:752099-Hanusia_phi.AAC.2
MKPIGWPSTAKLTVSCLCLHAMSGDRTRKTRGTLSSAWKLLCSTGWSMTMGEESRGRAASRKSVRTTGMLRSASPLLVQS